MKSRFRKIMALFMAAVLMFAVQPAVYAAEGKLPAPANIKSRAMENVIVLTWDSVSGASAYQVCMYDAKAKDYVEYKKVSGTQCTITDLEENTSYKFTITTYAKINKKSVKQKTSDVIEVRTIKSDPNWVTKDGDKYYKDGDSYVAGTTKEINGSLYLFDEDGKMLSGGIKTVGGKKYYCDKYGVVTVEAWVDKESGEKFYYADASGVITTYKIKGRKIYKNGKVITNKNMPGAMQQKYSTGEISYQTIGWYKIGKKYYFVEYDYNESEGVTKVKGLYNYNYSNAPAYVSTWERYTVFFDGTVFDNATSIFSSKPADARSVYDLGTGKKIGTFVGYPTFKNNRVIGGNVYDCDADRIVTFTKNSEIESVTKPNGVTVGGYSIRVNSVGGVIPKITFFNSSNKNIKYVTFAYNLYNSVNDILKDDITKKDEFSIKYTGPVSPGKGDSCETSSPLGYNYSAHHIVITSIKVDYMDGSSETISGDKLKYSFLS